MYVILVFIVLSIHIGGIRSLRLRRILFCHAGYSINTPFNSQNRHRAAHYTELGSNLKEIPMTTGTVKWFNSFKGFGFITPDEGGSDAFVHISAVERGGLSTLQEGQRVNYELQPGENGKSSAENLTISE